MAERPSDGVGRDLERELVELAAEVDYPPTPDLAEVVGGRLRGGARPHPLAPSPSEMERGDRRGAMSGVWGRGVGLAVAAVIVALLLGVALSVVPAVRTAIADRLGVRSIGISYLPWVPTATPTATPPPTPSPSPTAVPIGDRLLLGQRLSLADAESRVPFHVLIPSLPNLGVPDAVYVLATVPGGEVSLVYRPRPDLPPQGETGVGMLLAEFRGDLAPNLIAAKGLGPNTTLEMVTVDGETGYWIAGQPHLFFYRDANGVVRDEQLRLAGNTLLWQRGNLTLRLESALSKTEALRVATSLR